MQMATALRPALVAWLLVIFPWLAAGAPAGPAEGEPNQDAALTALVSETLTDNPRVQAAAAALAAAGARERGAGRAVYNPALELDVEEAGVQTASIGISQTIDWAGKRGARSAVATAERESYAAELASARQALASELLSALNKFHTRHELGLLSRRRTELTQRFLSLASRRHRAGDLPLVELNLAQLTAMQARMLQAQAGAARAGALQELVALVGNVRSAWPVFPDEPPELAPGRPDVGSLLVRLPALRAQRARVDAAGAAVQLKRRERQPDPTIALRGGREDSEDLVGLTLSIPLFVRNDYSAEVDASSEESIGAERQLQEMARRARSRLLFAAERYHLTRNAWMEWRQAGDISLLSQTGLLQRLWQAGELSTTDYLLQLTQSLDTQASALELRGKLWQGWIDWLAASGQVDDWLGLGPQHALDAR